MERGREEGMEGRRTEKKGHNRGKIRKAVQDIHRVTSLKIILNFYAPEKCEKCVKSLY